MSATRKKLLFLILILIIIGIINHYLKIDLEGIRAFLKGFFPWTAVFIYALIYVLSTIFLPLTKDMFKLIGAICLGVILSSLGIWIAETINAILLFYLARYLGRGFVKVRLRGRAKIIDERIGSSGFRGILILRLVPIIPYRVLDLLAGLSAISFIQYFIIVLIGSPLRIFWIQYILRGVGTAVFKNPAFLVDYMLANKVIFAWSLIYLILVILVAFRFKFKKRI